MRRALGNLQTVDDRRFGIYHSSFGEPYVESVLTVGHPFYRLLDTSRIPLSIYVYAACSNKSINENIPAVKNYIWRIRGEAVGAHSRTCQNFPSPRPYAMPSSHTCILSISDILPETCRCSRAFSFNGCMIEWIACLKIHKKENSIRSEP